VGLLGKTSLRHVMCTLITGPYFKVGIYRGKTNWKGDEEKSTLYFDELRMGGANATRDEVDPAKQK